MQNWAAQNSSYLEEQSVPNLKTKLFLPSMCTHCPTPPHHRAFKSISSWVHTWLPNHQHFYHRGTWGLHCSGSHKWSLCLEKAEGKILTTKQLVLPTVSFLQVWEGKSWKQMDLNQNMIKLMENGLFMTGGNLCPPQSQFLAPVSNLPCNCS